jgi:hypothetical protein
MNLRFGKTAVIVGAVLLLAACAGPNTVADVPDAQQSIAGFWSGLWHGFIMPIAFIGSLFDDSIGIYEVHNSGGWYDFGFLLGVSIPGGGCVSASRR